MLDLVGDRKGYEKRNQEMLGFTLVDAFPLVMNNQCYLAKTKMVHFIYQLEIEVAARMID